LIDDDAVCNAVFAVGSLGVLFLSASNGDPRGDEEDDTEEVEEVDVEVTDRCTDGLEETGLLGGVCPKNINDYLSLQCLSLRCHVALLNWKLHDLLAPSKVSIISNFKCRYNMN